jgi:hypothetical protein
MYTNFKAALLALVAAWSVQAADFDWEVAPIDGYPQIAFANATETKEVVFMYNYTGTLSATKFLSVKLLDRNCSSPADASLAFADNVVPGHKFEVDLDIVQETISTSKEYTENADGTKAEIDFCIRVDYEFDDGTSTESINFHETTVSISVDLTANFTLDSISVNRTAADLNQANATLDYPVQAYFCQDDNSEVNQPVLAQGSLLQFCVKIDDSVTAAVFVEDILEFTLSQPNAVPAVAASRPVTGTTPDPLTEKLCREMGICNIRHQLSSKWFSVPQPQPLRIDGIAILSFGVSSMMPSAAPTGARRRLRAPISGLLSADQVKAIMERQLAIEAAEAEAASNSQVALYEPRGLQAAANTAAASTGQKPFNLEVPLVSSNTQAEGNTSSSNTGVIIGVVAVVAILAALALYCFCVKRRNKKTVEEHKVVTTSTTQQQQQQSLQGGAPAGQYGGPQMVN